MIDYILLRKHNRSIVEIEKRREIASMGGKAAWLRLSDEEKLAKMRKMSSLADRSKQAQAQRDRLAELTPEQRKAKIAPARAAQTPEIRSQLVRAHIATLSDEERRARIQPMLDKFDGAKKSGSMKLYLAGLTEAERRERMEHAQRALTPDTRHMLGVNLNNLFTPEERVERSKRANALMSVEQRVQRGVKGVETLRKQKYEYEGVYFASLGEAATGVLLQKYIPDYRVIEGSTFQVTEGIGKPIDFLVGDIFIEYHPILPFKSRNGLGDFETQETYELYKKGMANCCTKEARDDYMHRFREMLLESYRSKRRFLLSLSEKYKNCELIVIGGPEELYDDVICRLGQNYPDKQEFIVEFKRLQKQIKKQHKIV